MSALISTHDAVHARMHEDVLVTLERLCERQTLAARAAFEAFVQLFDAHRALEEEEILPAYAGVAPVQGVVRVDHVEGDHTIIERHIGQIRADLEGLDDAPMLRACVVALPTPIRLLHVLEHHTEREAPVYRALAESLPAAVQDRLNARLAALLRSPAGLAGAR